MAKDYKKLYEDAQDRIKSLEIVCGIFKSMEQTNWDAYQRMIDIYRDMDKKMDKLRKENYALQVENRELKIQLKHD